MASTVPSHAGQGSGFLNLSSPTGGLAYLTPIKHHSEVKSQRSEASVKHSDFLFSYTILAETAEKHTRIL